MKEKVNCSSNILTCLIISLIASSLPVSEPTNIRDCSTVCVAVFLKDTG